MVCVCVDPRLILFMLSKLCDFPVGVMGIGSLSLSLRFAVGSLMHKLKARKMLAAENRTELANGSAVLHKTLNGKSLSVH